MKQVEIIAEIGQAHDGSLGTAHAMIDAVAKRGVKAAKFQMHIAAEESTPEDKFRVNFSYEDQTRYDYWRRMEFSVEQWAELKKHCEEKDIEFLCTPFSLEAVRRLEQLGIKRWKIGSGDTSNRSLLKAVSATGKPLLLSTGMSDYKEIRNVLDFMKIFPSTLTLFHCVSLYPNPPESIALEEIVKLRATFSVPIGFSDHSGEIYPCLLAVYLGAVAVEVHITFSKEAFGPDTSSSLNLGQLEELVRGISFVEKMLECQTDKDKTAAELKGQKILFSRSIVAAQDISAGEIISDNNLALKKPGTGLPEDQLSQVIGKIAQRNIGKNELIQHDWLG
jgi:N,N'-diacetyllegionaminate synthase